MGQVNRDLLQNFLSGHIQVEDLVSRLMALLEPFFQRAESGVYQLAPEAELNPEQVRVAIAQATGQEVTRIVFVSRERPFPRPPWMTEEGYQKGFKASLGTNLWASLGASLGASLQDSLQDSLGDSLRDSLGTNLWASLWVSLGTNLWARLGVSLGVSPRVSLRESLFYLLGSAIAGRTEVVERLVPLIELLLKALPLGVKKDEPGVWIVLVA